MRRHGTMVLAFALPLAVSFAALAQQPAQGLGLQKPVLFGAPSASASAKAAASAGAPAASATPSASASTAPVAVGDGGAPAPTSTDQPKAPGGMDGQTYAVRLRDLEQRVDELKDQIRRSHTRLALLSDTIIGGGAAGSRAEIMYRNEMSSAFALRRALFVLDGQIQYNRQDETGALADQKEIPIFSGSVPPGDHTISVLLNFQGNGYGVFTYLRGYKFEVKSSHAFTAVEGKTLQIIATSLEKGGVTTPLEQRPSIEWHEKVMPIGGGGSSTPTAAPAAPPVSGSVNVNLGGGKK